MSLNWKNSDGALRRYVIFNPHIALLRLPALRVDRRGCLIIAFNALRRICDGSVDTEIVRRGFQC